MMFFLSFHVSIHFAQSTWENCPSNYSRKPYHSSLYQEAGNMNPVFRQLGDILVQKISSLIDLDHELVYHGLSSNSSFWSLLLKETIKDL